MSYRVDREKRKQKKLSGDAENNTVVATADSNYMYTNYILTVRFQVTLLHT